MVFIICNPYRHSLVREVVKKPPLGDTGVIALLTLLILVGFAVQTQEET